LCLRRQPQCTPPTHPQTCLQRACTSSNQKRWSSC
jgi:hypothetical protein